MPVLGKGRRIIKQTGILDNVSNIMKRKRESMTLCII